MTIMGHEEATSSEEGLRKLRTSRGSWTAETEGRRLPRSEFPHAVPGNKVRALSVTDSFPVGSHDSWK